MATEEEKAPSMMTTGHSQTQTMIELTNALLPALKTQQLEKSSPTKLADSSSHPALATHKCSSSMTMTAIQYIQNQSRTAQPPKFYAHSKWSTPCS